MESEISQTIITFIVGGILGGFVKTYFDFRKTVVSAIWEKRFEQYKKLWAITGVLPKWPRDANVTYKHLYETSNNLKKWYFNSGGILLSKKSRKDYGDVQEALLEVAKKQTEDKISDENYERIRLLFNALRNQMTKDLTSRNRKLL